MPTLVGADGTMTSRPMIVQESDRDGVLWFFASDESRIGQGALLRCPAHVSLVDNDSSL
jgi:general stress protein 26